MTEYTSVFTKTFANALKRYASLHQQIKRRVDRVIEDPYYNTESLVDATGGLNLQGCRSARIDRNFRLIFVICEECRHIKKCEYCFCDDCPDKTVVFLSVGPHDRAYTMR